MSKQRRKKRRRRKRNQETPWSRRAEVPTKWVRQRRRAGFGREGQCCGRARRESSAAAGDAHSELQFERKPLESTPREVLTREHRHVSSTCYLVHLLAGAEGPAVSGPSCVWCVGQPTEPVATLIRREKGLLAHQKGTGV
jgi:hypothetical protein